MSAAGASRLIPGLLQRTLCTRPPTATVGSLSPRITACGAPSGNEQALSFSPRPLRPRPADARPGRVRMARCHGLHRRLHLRLWCVLTARIEKSLCDTPGGAPSKNKCSGAEAPTSHCLNATVCVCGHRLAPACARRAVMKCLPRRLSRISQVPAPTTSRMVSIPSSILLLPYDRASPCHRVALQLFLSAQTRLRVALTSPPRHRAAFGTSVGSKTLTLAQAVVVCEVFHQD